MERVILHCDCNSFFASVETLKHPEYASVPMAVGGDREKRHGIILAKNEKAKAFGVKTAEPIWQAERKCPGLVVVQPSFQDYERVSAAANRIYSDYTDAVEPFGIDESYLDMTGSLHLFAPDARAMADIIRERIKWETGVTVSVGASFCKCFAKLGSDMKKPDGTTVIPYANFREIVWPLPVSDLLYAGRHTCEKLSSLGIKTIGDLARYDVLWLKRLLGVGGEALWASANGLDTSPVVSRETAPERKSIGNGMTFPRDLVGEKDIRAAVSLLTDSVCMRMREAGVVCRTVMSTVRLPDLKNLSKRRTLSKYTDGFFEISGEAERLVRELVPESQPLRMITVSVSGLMGREAASAQTDVFGDRRLERLEDAVYGIKERFGTKSLFTGAMMGDLTLDGKQPRFL